MVTVIVFTLFYCFISLLVFVVLLCVFLAFWLPYF